MFIEPLKCPVCGLQGRPGAPFSSSSFGLIAAQVTCNCGHEFEKQNFRDQCVMSTHSITRIAALSNHFQCGIVAVPHGGMAQISFDKAFEYPSPPYLTPESSVFAIAQVANVRPEGMFVLAGRSPPTAHSQPMNVSWSVYGLVSVDNPPQWYVQFYGAVCQLTEGRFKPALIDYAVAFEMFLENFLRQALDQRVGVAASKLLLKKLWRVEDRSKELLELATGRRSTERQDVYNDWDEFVRKPRNSLAHGLAVSVDKVAAEHAHAATHDAIRWIETQCE